MRRWLALVGLATAGCILSRVDLVDREQIGGSGGAGGPSGGSPASGGNAGDAGQGGLFEGGAPPGTAGSGGQPGGSGGQAGGSGGQAGGSGGQAGGSGGGAGVSGSAGAAGACPNGGHTRCNGTCFDTNTSDMHCGRCGNACPSGYVCSNGLCSQCNESVPFCDDFTANAAVWTVLSGNWMIYSDSEEGYWGSGPGTAIVADASFDDVDIYSEMNFTSAGNGSAGLLSHYQESGDYYAVLLDQADRWFLTGPLNNPTGMCDPVVVNPPANYVEVRLRVNTDGDQATIQSYFAGVLRHNCTVGDPLPAGPFGVVVGGASGNGRFWYVDLH